MRKSVDPFLCGYSLRPPAWRISSPGAPLGRAYLVSRVERPALRRPLGGLPLLPAAYSLRSPAWRAMCASGVHFTFVGRYSRGCRGRFCLSDRSAAQWRNLAANGTLPHPQPDFSVRASPLVEMTGSPPGLGRNLPTHVKCTRASVARKANLDTPPLSAIIALSETPPAKL